MAIIGKVTKEMIKGAIDLDYGLTWEEKLERRIIEARAEELKAKMEEGKLKRKIKEGTDEITSLEGILKHMKIKEVVQ